MTGITERNVLLIGLLAVLLWSTLAVLTLQVSTMPIFFMTGIALLFGSVWGVSRWRSFSRSPRVWLIGVFGIFGFHAIYFFALRMAPPVDTQLVVEVWPMIMILLARGLLKTPLLRHHFIGIALSLVGLILAGGSAVSFHRDDACGLFLAFVSALIWALYSVGLKLLPSFTVATNSGFCFISGLLCLVFHWLFEPSVIPAHVDWLWLAAIGLGPLGLAFYCWDYAVKRGDAKQMATLCYLITVFATLWLTTFGSQPFHPMTGVALIFILSGCLYGQQSPRAKNVTSARSSGGSPET